MLIGVAAQKDDVASMTSGDIKVAALTGLLSRTGCAGRRREHLLAAVPRKCKRCSSMVSNAVRSFLTHWASKPYPCAIKCCGMRVKPVQRVAGESPKLVELLCSLRVSAYK